MNGRATSATLQAHYKREACDTRHASADKRQRPGMRRGVACFRDAGRSAHLWWHSQLQMPVLKQLARLAGCFSRLLSSCCRSASGIRAGAGLRARLHAMCVDNDGSQGAKHVNCNPSFSLGNHNHTATHCTLLKVHEYHSLGSALILTQKEMCGKQFRRCSACICEGGNPGVVCLKYYQGNICRVPGPLVTGA